ncbi:hypothetical protein IFM89_013469 [Coptis chinensis]|uniref:Aldehyde dehydrogenase domain-containing protein n=1 Tax=Coptis chinensis TaxID=261450 RepID=A0A835HMQ6_9MAGN|nr:hypothetical protein IFM89_013469 [Coptis chinensis]
MSVSARLAWREIVKWTNAYDGKTIVVYDPATGDVIANLACMGRRETSDAISSASHYLKNQINQGGVNVVMGNASEIGDTILESPQVRKITFTGSTAVGKKLMAGAAGTVKKVSLELGGNAPCIVFDDADLDLAVKISVSYNVTSDISTYNSSICEKFAGAFVAAVKNLQVGNGFTDGVTQGPLINEAAIQKDTFTKVIFITSANVTPHLGASTMEAQEGVAIEIADAFVGALKGELSSSL